MIHTSKVCEIYRLNGDLLVDQETNKVVAVISGGNLPKEYAESMGVTDDWYVKINDDLYKFDDVKAVLKGEFLGSWIMKANPKVEVKQDNYFAPKPQVKAFELDGMGYYDDQWFKFKRALFPDVSEEQPQNLEKLTLRVKIAREHLDDCEANLAMAKIELQEAEAELAWSQKPDIRVEGLGTYVCEPYGYSLKEDKSETIDWGKGDKSEYVWIRGGGRSGRGKAK